MAIKLTDPAHIAMYRNLLEHHGKSVAVRYAKVISTPPNPNCGGAYSHYKGK